MGATPLGATPNSIDLVSGAKRFRANDYRTAEARVEPGAILHHAAGSRIAEQTRGGAAGPCELAVLVSGRTASFLRLGQLGCRDRRSTRRQRVLISAPNRWVDDALYLGYLPATADGLHADVRRRLARCSEHQYWDAKTHWTLRDRYDSVWSLETFADVSTGLFTVARPVRITRRGGLQLFLEYGPSNELTLIRDSFGKTIGFEWRLIDPQAVGGTGDVLPGAISQANLPGGDKVKRVLATKPSARIRRASPSRTGCRRSSSWMRRTSSSTARHTDTTTLTCRTQ